MILRKFNCFCWRHLRAVTEKPLRGQTPTQDAKQTRWGYLIMMMIHARLGRTAAALAVVGGMTFAAATESHASLIYATEVDWFNNGTVGSSNDRDNPANSLGAPDDDFLSLGLSSDDNPGFAVFGFGQDFIEEGRIWEITFNCDPTCVDLETATIYVGTSDQYTMGQASRADQIALVTGMGGFFGEWTEVADVSNQDAQLSDGGAAFSFEGPFTWLAVVDTTPDSSNSTDGFDVNSIGVAPVPLPAAAWFLLTALGGLFGLRWLRDRPEA